MRLTIALLGFTFDASIEPSAADEDRAGDSTSFPVGFTASHDVPDDASIHRPTSPWEDDSEAGR